MAKGTTLEHTEAERISGTAHYDGIHLSLQGKGGVGKSLVASILAQYFRGRGRAIQCIDTDPVNRTFAQYCGINATARRRLLEMDVVGASLQDDAWGITDEQLHKHPENFEGRRRR